MRTVFISDLHLQADQPQITERFLRFLEEESQIADSLYILGDFFEVWLGDDDDSALALTIKNALAKASHRLEVFILVGNRDFLLGDSFAKACGATLLPDASLITLAGEKTLLMHGDALCTDDHAYQAFKQQVRTPEFIQAFLQKSLPERRSIARHMREQSAAHNQTKSQAIMDVNEHTVITTMQQYQVQHLIHGHTHRPQQHLHRDNHGNTLKRTVLGAWDNTDDIVIFVCENNKVAHQTLFVNNSTSDF